MTPWTLRVDDPRLRWDGVVELEVVRPGWVRPLRVLREHLLGMSDPSFLNNAAASTGARVALHTDAASIGLGVLADLPDTSPIDVLVDGSLSERVPLEPGENRVRIELPAGERLVEIWLPQHGIVALSDLRLDRATRVGPVAPPVCRWAAYGSSITACRAAAGPSETWPALVATENRWSNLNLGFAGSCHLDDAVARTIASRPIDLVTVCLGINIYSQLTYNERSLPNAILGFLGTVRDAHPTAPILVISPIACPKWEQEPNAVGLTLAALRGLVHRTVSAVAARPDPALHLLDGLEVVGADEEQLLWDGLHPSAAGYREMATRLAPRLRALVAGPTGEQVGGAVVHENDQAQQRTP